MDFKYEEINHAFDTVIANAENVMKGDTLQSGNVLLEFWRAECRNSARFAFT